MYLINQPFLSSAQSCIKDTQRNTIIFLPPPYVQVFYLLLAKSPMHESSGPIHHQSNLRGNIFSYSLALFFSPLHISHQLLCIALIMFILRYRDNSVYLINPHLAIVVATSLHLLIPWYTHSPLYHSPVHQNPQDQDYSVSLTK